MSLLMDALKRAETSKQAAARGTGGMLPESPDALSLEPIAATPPRGPAKPLPELAAHLDALDAELASSAIPPAPPGGKSGPQKPRQQAERAATHNAFAVKQSPAPPSRQPLWLALGGLGLAVFGIAGYVAYQILNLGGNTLSVSTPPPNPGIDSVRSTPSPAPPVPVPAVPMVLPPVGESTVGLAGDRPLFAPAPARPARPAPASAPAAVATGDIRLTRSQAEVDPDQLRGHANLQRNDLELARRDYEQALRRDPNNTDALLALAAIAQHQGRAGDAEQLRQRALVANPSDPAVQGAVLNGASAAADPQNTESRLKSLLAAQPESAPLNFALGNLHARQNRWAEAQAAYFNAVAADGDNPDYLFNLAVSLDHLRQGKLAAQHYRLALAAADKRPAAFAPEPVKKRLAELQP